MSATTKGPIAWSPAPGRSDASSTRGRRTRSRILRSAMAVFGKRGFADTTVLDIAEHAGMASGTVYQSTPAGFAFGTAGAAGSLDLGGRLRATGESAGTSASNEGVTSPRASSWDDNAQNT